MFSVVNCCKPASLTSGGKAPCAIEQNYRHVPTALNYISGKIYLNSDTKYTILDPRCIFYWCIITTIANSIYIFYLYDR